MSKSSHADKLEIINAHPRLGAKASTLSQQSALEQRAINNSSADRLITLNEEYEQKFGFKFVCFVNGRSQSELVPVMQERLQNSDANAELETGLREMMNIARDRLRKLQQ